MRSVTRAELARSLRERVSPEEWAALEAECPTGPISAYNRSTLLRLRDDELSDGVLRDSAVAESDVARLESMLRDFLNEHLPDDPIAQERITLSCLALTFVFEKPLHPAEAAGWSSRAVEGKECFYCPQHDGPDTICGFCACRPMAELHDC